MLIYNRDNIQIDFNLEVVPAIVTFTIFNKDYKYTLGGDNLDNCKYDKSIQKWFEDNKSTLTEIIWEWNLNKPEYSKIEVPLTI